ncbi:PAS domain S-box-containing protein [Desulfatibacillum alkenivorans DSM 16219]|jgi:PAS domain S-box-containing protein|uniref:histidine kinase n=1 Tax=Desulfatibacillum alkenivorans DSM 16219 TaxID=1121393 RepID=A0A1M6LDH3_9BACT|nr:PAS domain S-box protein [Desulfatibacillum alkenivorans]SHJ69253.1 PAS domain S-box-containing protein [Desulfatibacillum alkenivorans DSM 16219]
MAIRSNKKESPEGALRQIVSVLALLAFLSIVTGGVLYVSFLQKAAVSEADHQAVNRIKLVARHISDSLSENERPVKTLAGMRRIVRALETTDLEATEQANRILDHFKETLNADVCYLIDVTGLTIASSNRHFTDSFVGKNFGFRPYFQKAMEGRTATYLALGSVSDKRGVYSSHPVMGSDGELAGVVVIKASVDLIESSLTSRPEEDVLVADPNGVVFISSKKQWLLKTLWPLKKEQINQVQDSQQFGPGPWPWIGFRPTDSPDTVELKGARFLMHEEPIRFFPGWSAYYIQSEEAISQRVSSNLFRVTGIVVITSIVLVGLLVFLLYTRALVEINRRIMAEGALRQSEERYRAIYHNTPAMLHSINSKGRLVSVSDHWLKALQYETGQVIGKHLGDFMTPSSAQYLRETMMPEFLRTGECIDVSYQFVKKNGEVMDVLLSAIGERDEEGRFVRSLAVSVDVTEQKKAQEALNQAQEKLSQHSQELERQVFRRTEEISSILKYTPNLVHIKDAAGRYIMVNRRYEEIFGISNEDVRGKTQHESMPKEYADAFREVDHRVLSEKKPVRSEYVVRVDGEDHSYLSVKFPIYDEQGRIHAIGGISTDVTEIKKAQEALRRLSNRMIISQEAERQAIARELHDELGQILTVLRMDAVWFKKRLKDSDAATQKRASAMCELIDKTIEDVRGIAVRLRPGVLDDLGLVDALEWYTSDFERRTGITCIFEHDNIPNLGNAISTAAYRIAQEALTNVVRHASTDRADVSLSFDQEEFTLVISDNGVGYDGGMVEESEGLGIAGMRERAMLAGGTLEVEAGEDAGSRIIFRIKVSGANKEK